MTPSSECIDFVRAELARGPQPVAALMKRAEGKGFTLGMVLMAFRAVMEAQAWEMRHPPERPRELRAG